MHAHSVVVTYLDQVLSFARPGLLSCCGSDRLLPGFVQFVRLVPLLPHALQCICNGLVVWLWAPLPAGSVYVLVVVHDNSAGIWNFLQSLGVSFT